MRHNALGKSKEAINGEDGSKKDADYSWVDKLGFWPRRIWYVQYVGNHHVCVL